MLRLVRCVVLRGEVLGFSSLVLFVMKVSICQTTELYHPSSHISE